MAERRHKNDVGITRIHDQFANRARILQANVLPGFAGVHRLPDAVTMRDVSANARFAGSRIYDIGIGHGDSDTADRRGSVFVKNRRPGVRGVGRLPDAATGRTEVVDGRVAGNSGGSERAAATKGSDRTVLHSLEERVTFVLFVFVFVFVIFRGGIGGAGRIFL